MKISATTLSLNVPDEQASARFAVTHFGFKEEMSADGFVAIGHPTAGINIAFLRTGLKTFKPAGIAGSAGEGLLIAFVVEDLDPEFGRISGAGAQVVTEPETEPWGERYCQFADPNGIVWQLVSWVAEPVS